MDKAGSWVSFVKNSMTYGGEFPHVEFNETTSVFLQAKTIIIVYKVWWSGLGIVIPQSDVSLFGHRQNNYYHVTGYIFGLDLELRYEFRKHIFVETGFKGTFANYECSDCWRCKSQSSFWCMQYIGAVGYQIALWFNSVLICVNEKAETASNWIKKKCANLMQRCKYYLYFDKRVNTPNRNCSTTANRKMQTFSLHWS